MGKKTLYIFFILLVFSGCTTAYYSHYPKVKRDKKEAEKTAGTFLKNFTISQPTIITQKTSPRVQKGNETITVKTISPHLLPPKSKLTHKPTRPSTHTPASQNTVDPEEKPAPNTNPTPLQEARTAFILSILGWVVTAIGALVLLDFILLFIISGLVMEIAAIILGVSAARDIKKSDNKKGKGMAGTAIALSGLYLLICVLAIVVLTIIMLSFK